MQKEGQVRMKEQPPVGIDSRCSMPNRDIPARAYHITTTVPISSCSAVFLTSAASVAVLFSILAVEASQPTVAKPIQYLYKSIKQYIQYLLIASQDCSNRPCCSIDRRESCWSLLARIPTTSLHH